MNKLFTCLPVIISLFLFVGSCKKIESNDPGLLPNIVFKTGSGYTSKDTTVAAGTVLKTGINANKSEPTDVLKIFSITRIYDGGLSSNMYKADLTGSQGDNYSYDYNITTRTSAGTEKYTYTVSNRDGLVNSISLTVTTQ